MQRPQRARTEASCQPPRQLAGHAHEPFSQVTFAAPVKPSDDLAPDDVVTGASRGTLSQNYPAKLLPFPTHRSWKVINVRWWFKPLYSSAFPLS